MLDILKGLVENCVPMKEFFGRISTAIDDAVAGGQDTIDLIGTKVSETLTGLLPPIFNFIATVTGAGSIKNAVTGSIKKLKEKAIALLDTILDFVLNPIKDIVQRVGAYLGFTDRAMVFPRSQTEPEGTASVSLDEDGEVMIARSPGRPWKHLDPKCQSDVDNEYKDVVTKRDAFKAIANSTSGSTPEYSALLTAVDKLAKAVAKKCKCDPSQKNCENAPGSGRLSNCEASLLKTQVGGKPASHSAHHLIPCSVAQQYDVMQKAADLGYDINGFNNGLALPNAVSLSRSTGLPLHRGGHLGNYFACAKSLLDNLENRYKSKKLAECDICREVRKAESKLRDALLNRDIWLNTDDPNIATNATWQCPK